MYANLETDNTLYVFMHAEQVYTGSESYDSCSIIGETTIENIYLHICKIDIKSIIIDFDEIKKEKNGVTWMGKIIQHCKEKDINLTLCRIEKGLLGALKLEESLKIYYDADFRKKDNGNGTVNIVCSDSPIYSLTNEIISLVSTKNLRF